LKIIRDKNEKEIETIVLLYNKGDESIKFKNLNRYNYIYLGGLKKMMIM
jgi:hypothetical protein